MQPSSPHDLFPLLASQDLEERLNAIRFLGEMGDAEALAVLRTRLKTVSAEHAALIAAAGKLKRRLRVQ
jgi:HEAT repeat protein